MKSCPSCGSENKIAEFICNSCEKIQLVSDNRISIFSLFNLKPTLEVDKKSLEKKYFELIAMNHPDNVKLSAERSIAEANTSLLNSAYEILQSPLRTCEYILNEMTKSQENNISTDTDMSEIFSLQNELNNIQDDYEIFKQKIANLHNFTLSKVKENIISKNVISAQQHMSKLKFLDSILQKTRAKAFALESKNAIQGYAAPAA